MTIAMVTTVFSGCSNSNRAIEKKESTKMTVTDMSGEKTQVPKNSKRIGDGWPAHNEVLCMLGYGNNVVSTILTRKQEPWLYKVNPQMNESETVFTKTDVNMESLIKTKPDIVFLPTSYNFDNKIKKVGISVVKLNFTNFDELKSCFKLTGKILGSKSEKKADKYNKYLDNKINTVSKVTLQIPENQKLKVLHIQNIAPLTVDGSNTIIDSWIKVAGGINVASEVKGNMKEVSMEQILKWNPDVIILGADVKDEGAFFNSSAWKNINAVKNNKIIHNPNGAFMWDRYGAEEALQIQWAAKTLYPNKFSDLDITNETIKFYKEFLNYNLTKEEAERIIKGKAPVD
nr:ABC transporter substrate-binding protein [Clostridium acetobutylicum]